MEEPETALPSISAGALDLVKLLADVLGCLAWQHRNNWMESSMVKSLVEDPGIPFQTLAIPESIAA